MEIDPFCQRVLAKNFSGVPIHDDITTFDASHLRGTIDLVTGGFPCQPFSVAGQRRGNDDDRALWPEMRRVIAEIQPRWVVAENVPGFINMALDDLFSNLDALGYDAGALVVPAAGVGAPHIRQRLWILACMADAASVRIGDAPVPPDPITASGETRPVPASGSDGGGAAQPDHTSDRREAERRLGRSPHDVSPWLDGTWEHGIPRTIIDQPDRTARLKALGNAICPQVAYEIIRHLPGVIE